MHEFEFAGWKRMPKKRTNTQYFELNSDCYNMVVVTGQHGNISTEKIKRPRCGMNLLENEEH